MTTTRRRGWLRTFGSNLGKRQQPRVAGIQLETRLRLEPLESRRLLTMDQLLITAEIAGALDANLDPRPMPLPGELPGEPVVFDVRLFLQMTELDESSLGFGNVALDVELTGLGNTLGWLPNNPVVDHDGILVTPAVQMFSENGDFGPDGQDLQSIIVGTSPLSFGPVAVDPRRTLGQDGPMHIGNVRVEWDGLSAAGLAMTITEFSTYDAAGFLVRSLDGVGTGVGLDLPLAEAGPEFQVNTFTTGDQRTWESSLGAVASDGDGDTLVTWSSQSQDGSGWGVFAQRYDPAGAAVGPEFQVNSTTFGDQRNSVVAMDADGDSVIVWSSLGQDGDDFGIYGQRFDAAGQAQGSEFRISQTLSGSEHLAHVAMNTEGSFVVTWSTRLGPGVGSEILARRYDAHGVPLGNEFLVNSTSAGNQRYSAAAIADDDSFIVTWSSEDQDGDDFGVYGQRYDSAGQSMGGEFLINTRTAGRQFRQHLSMARDGRFVVAWSSQGQDGSGDGIYAQRFFAGGSPDGAEFRVNQTTAGDQQMPRVAMAPNGDFAVAFNSRGQDGDNWGVYLRHFAAGGSAVSDEVQVNTFTTGPQQDSGIAVDDDGDVVVAYSSLVQDGDSLGVFARRFQRPGDTTSPVVAGLFADGNHHHIQDNQRLVSQVDQLVVSFSEALTSDGGGRSVTDSDNWTLLRDGADVSHLISGVDFAFDAAGKDRSINNCLFSMKRNLYGIGYAISEMIGSR